MKRYNWQQSDWPHFRYDVSALQSVLLAITEKNSFIQGKMSFVDKRLQTEALLNVLMEEAMKTSAIEGEYISRKDVRSSIKNKLGLTQSPIHVQDKRTKGIVEILFNARASFNEPLSEEQLCEWHFLLLSGNPHPHLMLATWRTDAEPMQIVSGSYGKWKVHFEAPPSARVPAEMAQFIAWFNDTAPGAAHPITSAPVRAAIAHLYFESIHPFDDGNGRIGRVIAEKALSQGYGYPIMFSLSQAIEANKKDYYNALHTASRMNEVTPWIAYFARTLLQSQHLLETQITFIFKKTAFFDRYKDALNERQLKVMQRMWRAGPRGFEGGMSAKKYMVIANTSKATATRDLQHLLSIEALVQQGEGRSVRYMLALSEKPT